MDYEITLAARCSDEQVEWHRTSFEGRHGMPLHQFEARFDRYGENAIAALESLLDDFPNQFFRIEGFSVVEGLFHFQWPAHDDAERFLEAMMGFMSLIGFHEQEGQVMGDEGRYVCVLGEDGLDCHYRDGFESE